ncbi:MAG: hypothetical protein ACK52I_29225, partial [Pseudomonadota bacterium]
MRRPPARGDGRRFVASATAGCYGAVAARFDTGRVSRFTPSLRRSVLDCTAACAGGPVGSSLSKRSAQDASSALAGRQARRLLRERALVRRPVAVTLVVLEDVVDTVDGGDAWQGPPLAVVDDHPQFRCGPYVVDGPARHPERHGEDPQPAG